MRCPHCQAPLHEQSPCCPQCHFDLDEAGRTFGLPPQLQIPLTDLASVLTARQQGTIVKALNSFSQRFPQVLFHVVVAKLPKDQNIREVAFWLFNRGKLCAAVESAGACHDALLFLDAENHRAACVVGYGLEPFLAEEALHSIAEAAVMGLRTQNYMEAIHAALVSAENIFAAVCETAPRNFGLQEHDIHDTPLNDQSFAY
jgi:uncharacterized membrane protein YgcG